MSFKDIGRTFPNKSGKSSTLILSKKDLEFLMTQLKPTEKYGEQVRLILTSKGIAIIQDNSVAGITEQENKNNLIDVDTLPF